MLYDSIIIGGGPAGLSAALALGRVCRSVLLFDSGVYRNAGVTAMHTVLSRDGTSPSEFRSIAVSQIKRYPSVQFKTAQVEQIVRKEIEPGYMGFQATDSHGETHSSRKVILAAGTEDILPDEIPGYRENWPQHIYQCLFCDGFEERHWPIGVLDFANPSYIHLVLMALNLNQDVTIYSNGPISEDKAVQQALKMALASKAKLDTRTIKRLVNNGPGPQNGITIEFETGPGVKLGMLVHKPPIKNRAQHLIDQLGLFTKQGSPEIIVDPLFCETSVPGCLAAGDNSEVIKQVALSMGTGLRAGVAVSVQLCNEEGARAMASLENEQKQISTIIPRSAGTLAQLPSAQSDDYFINCVTVGENPNLYYERADQHLSQDSAVVTAVIMVNDTRSHPITSPSSLAELARAISSQRVQIPISKIELQLLKPLSTESILTACRKHPDSFSRNSYGPKTVEKDSVKVLSLTPLFEAWRTVWATFPLDLVQHFVFDIDLPAFSSENDRTDLQIHWGHNVPEVGGLAVMEGKVSQSVLELATVMGVRSRRTAIFSLTGAEEYRTIHPRSNPKAKRWFQDLEEALQRLSSSA